MSPGETRICPSCDTPIGAEDARCWLCEADLEREPRTGSAKRPGGAVIGSVLAVLVTLLIWAGVAAILPGAAAALAIVGAPALLAVALAHQREHLRAARTSRTGRLAESLGVAFHTLVIIGLCFALFQLALLAGLLLLCTAVAAGTEPDLENGKIFALVLVVLVILGASFFLGRKIGTRAVARRRRG